MDSTDVPDPVTYRMDEALGGIPGHLESKGFAYSTESMAVLEELREVIASNSMRRLLVQHSVNWKRPWTQFGAGFELFEPEIRRALEEEGSCASIWPQAWWSAA